MPTYNLLLQTWVTDASSGGPKIWANPGNAKTLDGLFATAGSPTGNSNFLLGTNPSSFSPAANEILTQVQLSVTRDGGAGVNHVQDWFVYLVKSATIQTAVNKAAGGNWPQIPGLAQTTYTFSQADLATLGMTLSDWQNTGAGAAFAFQGDPLSGGNVDQIAVVLTTIAVSSSSPLQVIPPHGVQQNGTL